MPKYISRIYLKSTRFLINCQEQINKEGFLGRFKIANFMLLYAKVIFCGVSVHKNVSFSLLGNSNRQKKLTSK